MTHETNDPNTQPPGIDAELSRRMEETAALPPHDPQRLALLNDILAASPQAEAFWLNLITTDERTRLELLRITPPAGLADRLCSLTQDESHTQQSCDFPPLQHSNPFLRPRLWATVSVAAMIILAVSVTLTQINQDQRTNQRFTNLANVALSHHDYHGPTTPYPFKNSNPQIIRASLKKSPPLDFEVMLPHLGPEYQLIGAGICKLNGQKVACSRWTRDGKAYTVYQFCPKNFELPDAFDEFEICHEVDDLYVGVTFWTEGPCAYALAGEDEHHEF